MLLKTAKTEQTIDKIEVLKTIYVLRQPINLV